MKDKADVVADSRSGLGRVLRPLFYLFLLFPLLPMIVPLFLVIAGLFFVTLPFQIIFYILYSIVSAQGGYAKRKKWDPIEAQRQPAPPIPPPAIAHDDSASDVQESRRTEPRMNDVVLMDATELADQIEPKKTPPKSVVIEKIDGVEVDDRPEK
jgi:hypothetical protein